MRILIINSHGHWLNGWMSFPKSQEIVVNNLKQTGCQVNTIEVTSLHELTNILQKTTKDTLIWANAYWINGENGKEFGLIEQIENYNLPIIGSSSAVLNLLLEKDSCQQALKEANIPIPAHFIISNDKVSNVRKLLTDNNLSFPLVIKPTKESRSQGVTKADNLKKAIETIKLLSDKFSNSNIIVEEFLPTDDITCGYLKRDDEIMILPSFNVVKGMDCSTEIFNAEHYNFSSSYGQQPIVDNDNIIKQLEEVLPAIIDTLDIRGVTRIDARLDKNGTLKVFDINGMPGLNFSTSALIKQCFVHFPKYEQNYLFACLVNTIIEENLSRYNMEIPISMQENNLFNLESTTVIRTSYQNTMKREVLIA